MAYTATEASIMRGVLEKTMWMAGDTQSDSLGV